jgi:hypothetical protein
MEAIFNHHIIYRPTGSWCLSNILSFTLQCLAAKAILSEWGTIDLLVQKTMTVSFLTNAMADNETPAIGGSKSFEEGKIELSESQDGEVAEEGLESDNDIYEEILLAKEMARIIAENPILKPAKLKDVQEMSKQQVAETVAAKKRKKRGFKKIKSTIKAGVKEVTERRDQTFSQSFMATPGTSPIGNRSLMKLSIRSISKSWTTVCRLFLQLVEILVLPWRGG